MSKNKKFNDFDTLLERFSSPESRLRLEKDRRDFDIPVHDAIWSFVGVQESYLQRYEAIPVAISEAQKLLVLATEKALDAKIADSEIIINRLTGNVYTTIADAASDAAGEISRQAVKEINSAIKTQQHIDLMQTNSVGIILCSSALVVAIGVADLIRYVKTFDIYNAAHNGLYANTFDYLYNIPVGYFFIAGLSWLAVLSVIKLSLKIGNRRINQVIAALKDKSGWS